jgi:hypothetical protein
MLENTGQDCGAMTPLAKNSPARLYEHLKG